MTNTRGLCHESLVKLRLAAIGILVGVLLTLPVLAHRSPPDPSWITGFWDDADYDDAVVAATSASAIADTNAFFDLEPVRTIAGSLVTYRQQLSSTPEPSPHRSRAPPTS